jgi:hypothetical protein
MKRLNQTGSHVLGFALLVLALGVVGFAGYTVMNANKSTDTTTATTTKTSSAAPGSIQNTADLNQAASALDSSSAQVNSGLDDSQLSSSLNDML